MDNEKEGMELNEEQLEKVSGGCSDMKTCVICGVGEIEIKCTDGIKYVWQCRACGVEYAT